jgi:uncharacterized membrane protein YgcG
MTDQPQLGVYEVAYLAGGPDRVVDTAVVVLVESGRVRVHAPGELVVVEPGRSDPVEAAVMDAIGTQGHRSIDTIRWRMAGDERVAELGRSLAAAGLLHRRPFARAKPDGPAWSATKSGRHALLHARAHPPVARGLDGGSALAVALDGRAAMPDAGRRAEIFERPLPPLPRTSGMDRRIRNSGLHDPAHAAFRGQHAAIGGAATFGFLGGGGSDGGGGGGGDGGS